MSPFSRLFTPIRIRDLEIARLGIAVRTGTSVDRAAVDMGAGRAVVGDHALGIGDPGDGHDGSPRSASLSGGGTAPLRSVISP